MCIDPMQRRRVHWGWCAASTWLCVHTINTPWGGGELPLLVTSPVRMMGLPIARVSEADVVALALDGVRVRRGGWICPVNLDVLRKVVGDPAHRALVEAADLR